MALDRQYAFDDMINHKVSDTDDIVEFPNRLLCLDNLSHN